MSNPEKADPIVADIDRDISEKEKELGNLEKDLESIRKERSEAKPQTGEYRFKVAEYYETERKRDKVAQELKYLQLRKETRIQVARRDYMRAFDKGQSWPDPEEFRLYQTNKRLNSASRSWEERLRSELMKRKPPEKKSEKKSEKKPAH